MQLDYVKLLTLDWKLTDSVLPNKFSAHTREFSLHIGPNYTGAVPSLSVFDPRTGELIIEDDSRPVRAMHTRLVSLEQEKKDAVNRRSLERFYKEFGEATEA